MSPKLPSSGALESKVAALDARVVELESDVAVLTAKLAALVAGSGWAPDYDLPEFNPDVTELTLNRAGNQIAAITDALNGAA